MSGPWCGYQKVVGPNRRRVGKIHLAHNTGRFLCGNGVLGLEEDWPTILFTGPDECVPCARVWAEHEEYEEL